VTAPVEDVIAAVLAHHDRRAKATSGTAPEATSGQMRCRSESLQVLFGERAR
jgi:hypothetical protein